MPRTAAYSVGVEHSSETNSEYRQDVRRHQPSRPHSLEIVNARLHSAIRAASACTYWLTGTPLACRVGFGVLGPGALPRAWIPEHAFGVRNGVVPTPRRSHANSTGISSRVTLGYAPCQWEVQRVGLTTNSSWGQRLGMGIQGGPLDRLRSGGGFGPGMLGRTPRDQYRMSIPDPVASLRSDSHVANVSCPAVSYYRVDWLRTRFMAKRNNYNSGKSHGNKHQIKQ